MNIDKNKCFSIAVIISFAILPISFISSLISSQFQSILNQNEEIETGLKTSQVSENFTVSSTLHELIWIEGRLTLLLTANESGLINCEFKDSQEGKFFTLETQSIILMGNNDSQRVQFIFKPHITTLPGKYNFTLSITGFYDYRENFSIVLGMGYIILLFILIIFGLSVVVIILKKKDGKVPKTISSSSEEQLPSSVSEVPSSKIQCPECKKQIDEGLTFCPECGGRIPEFLRFNPNSPRGL